MNLTPYFKETGGSGPGKGGHPAILISEGQFEEPRDLLVIVSVFLDCGLLDVENRDDLRVAYGEQFVPLHEVE